MRSIKARMPRTVLIALILLLACTSSPAVFCGDGGDTTGGEPGTYYSSPTFHPRWTPDGNGIVFTGLSKFGGTLYIAASDGSELRRVSKSKGNDAELDYSPDISPTGELIVYATSRFGGGGFGPDRRERNFEIETSDLKGNDRERLTDNEADDILPKWSPSGESIAFIRSGWGTLEEGIYLMNPDGSDARLLFPFSLTTQDNTVWSYGSRPGMGITWSPDGSALAAAWTEGHGRDILLVIPGDGSEHSRIFSAPYRLPAEGNGQAIPLGWIHGEPAWSPDGKKLAFLYHHRDYPMNNEEGCANKRPGAYLCIVNSDGSGLSGIPLPSDSAWGGGAGLSWSPGGERILLTEDRHGRISPPLNDHWISVSEGRFLVERSGANIRGVHIVSMDVSTGEASTVAPGVHASWSPDGSRIAVLGKYDDGGYLATVAPDGSDFRVLVKADEDGDLELADN